MLYGIVQLWQACWSTAAPTVARQLHFTLALALELLLAQQAKKHTTVMNVVRSSHIRVMNFLTVAMLQEGPDSTVILHDKQEIQTLENVSTEMTISVSASFLTIVEWSFFGTDYIFPITHWSTTAINTLVKRFHLLPRDPSQYGQVIENDEGNITQHVDSHQKVREAYSMNTSILKLLKRTVYVVGKHCVASSQGCDDHFGKDSEDT